MKGKFLKLTNKDFYNILKLLKESLIKKIDTELNYKDIEDLKFLKWCYDKLLLETTDKDVSCLKSGSIHWVNFGQNIGSELRKLRPAILWRSSSDKKMWTVIPLSTKCYQDKYYFHYDIESLKHSTAKIESVANFSYKRIKEPYFYNKKIAHLTIVDFVNIILCLQKYYTFTDQF